MDELGTDELSAYVIWVPRLGGTPDHVPEASTIIINDRTQHYWDEEEDLGTAYGNFLELGIEAPAWDIYLLYDAGVEWPEGSVPVPVYWEHQMSDVTTGPQLDGEVFRERVTEALQKAAAQR